MLVGVVCGFSVGDSDAMTTHTHTHTHTGNRRGGHCDSTVVVIDMNMKLNRNDVLNKYIQCGESSQSTRCRGGGGLEPSVDCREFEANNYQKVVKNRM